jgi:putative ABC transport system ATP-binding protein
VVSDVPALEARGVSKTYDRVEHVLEAVDLAVDPGEVVVVMGRSGSGKTTLLNILAGLETPTEGRVFVGEEEMTALEEEQRTRLRRREVGVVFQRFHLIPELSVLENARLPMKLAGRSDATERALELLGFFGLDHRTDAYPATLSGGETQRAAIARALGNEPAVVLADEPTANLDEGNARTALDALREVAEELGTAVVVATHDPLGAEAGDRVLDLVDGQLERDGPGPSKRAPGGEPGEDDEAGDVGPQAMARPGERASSAEPSEGEEPDRSPDEGQGPTPPGEPEALDEEDIPEVQAEALGPSIEDEDEAAG